jgi:hypothetical protein
MQAVMERCMKMAKREKCARTDRMKKNGWTAEGKIMFNCQWSMISDQ